MFKASGKRRGFLQSLTFGAFAPAILPAVANAQQGKQGKGKGAERTKDKEKAQQDEGEGNEVEIALKNVPPKLIEAATKAAPGIKWTTAFKNEEEGMVIYEIEGLDKKNREVTVTVNADGKVEEIETEIPEAEVPEVVMKAFRAKFPRMTIDAITEIKEDHKVVGYDFEGTRANKTQVGVYVTADGSSVHIEQN